MLPTIGEVKLSSRISDILLEFSEIDKDTLTTSDLQGIAMAKAMEIIRIVKEA